MAEERISTGIILSKTVMEHLDDMAGDDFRPRSSEIEYLVEKEWNLRIVTDPTAPAIVSVRRGTRKEA